jgi:ribonuclease P protein component
MQRFKTRAQFQAALAGGQVAKSEHFVLHQVELTFNLSAHAQSKPLFLVDDAWIGAMVPKRWAKRAVTRNAIKRQIYTVSTSLQHVFPQEAFLVRLRREFSRQTFLSASSDALKEAVRNELLVLINASRVKA